MRRNDRRQYLVGAAGVYEVARNMAAVAVENEKPPAPACLVSREAVKYLFKPGKPKLVISPS